MIEKKDVEHLAELSRLTMTDEETQEFQEDLGSILEYVDSLKEVSASVDLEPQVGPVHNVLREDTASHDQGEHREELVESFPETDNGYLKVKKILN